MRPLPLLTAALLALAGCAHAPSPGGGGGAGLARAQAQERCELVRTLVREPVPASLLEAVKPGTGPAPVMVFLRQEGLLERFFEDGAVCEDARFTVERESTEDALVLYLEPTPEGGFRYEARRSSPDALVLEGAPTGRVVHTESGWVSAGEVP
jgi:hypothetical protein